jgi:hypothetical protein
LKSDTHVVHESSATVPEKMKRLVQPGLVCWHFSQYQLPSAVWVTLYRFLHGSSLFAQAVYQAPPSLSFFRKLNLPLKLIQSGLSGLFCPRCSFLIAAMFLRSSNQTQL